MTERLEGRVLLTGTLIAGNGLNYSPAAPNFWPNPVPQGYSVTLSGGLNGASTSGAAAGPFVSPTGTITVEWYQGTVLATLPVTADPIGSGTYFGSIPDSTFTLNQIQAGTPITGKYNSGDYVLEFIYSGDANFAPWPALDAADFTSLSTGPSTGNSAELFAVVNFGGSSTETQAAFLQQPQDAAAGDTITPPVTVAVENASGGTVTTSASSVTLALAGGSGTATLSGTTTEPVVAGIATFSDLSVNDGGSYTLTATAGSDTSAHSNSFTITAGKLVFLPPPLATTQNTGKPLQPTIKVELEDGSSNPITSEDGAIVTLSLIGSTDTNPVTGNTAALSGGIATFSNVVLTKPGIYQLQASDPDGDAMGTSNKFGIGGDTLKFVIQPKDADPGDPLSVKVEALTPKGPVDTTLTDTIQLSLNTVSGGTHATLAGTTTVVLVGGVATFTPAAAVSINASGTYTLGAAALSGGAADFTVTSGTSDPFSIFSDHLAFLKKPVPTDVASPLAFTVAVEDKKNRIQTTVSSGGVMLSFSRGSGAIGQLSAYTDSGFASGVDTFTPPNSPSFNFPGSYTLTATQIDGSGTAVAGTATASIPVKILGLHIELVVPPPSDVPEFKFIPIKLEVMDSKGNLATSVNDYLNVTTTNSSSSAEKDGVPTFTDGVYEFFNDSSVGENTTYFDLGTGTNGLIFTAGFSRGKADDPSIAAATSRPIKVTGYHIKYLTQPTNVSVYDAIPFEVAIEDDHNNILMKDSEHTVRIPDEQAMVVSSPVGVTLSNYNTPAIFTDGVFSFPGAQADGSHVASTVVAPPYPVGTYDITVTALYNTPNPFTAAPITYIEPGVSRKFKILPLRLGFVQEPLGISVNFPIPAFSVQVEDINGAFQPYADPAVLDATYRLTKGGPVHDLGQATESNAIANFQLLSILYPGTYTITITQDAASVYPNNTPFIPVTSLPFTMV